MSGLYITESFINKENHKAFVIRRVARIYPGLIICVLITVFIIGPLFTVLPLKAYFNARDTWTYLMCNSTTYRIKFFLPGIFLHNYSGTAVNGSLWTLSLEIRCYFLIFIAGMLNLFKYKPVLIAVYLIILIAFLTNSRYSIFLNAKPAMFFMFGSLAYLFRKSLPVNLQAAVILWIVCFLVHKTIFYIPVCYMSIIYTAMVSGASNLVKKLKLPGDYSYGIYIYGFLLQQIVAFYLPNIRIRAS